MTNVIVVFPKLEDAKNIRSLLLRHGYTVPTVCTAGGQALQFVEGLDDGIVICGYKVGDMMYTELREYLPSRFEMILVASQHLWSECVNNDIICLAMPIKVHDLLSTVDMIAQTIARRHRKKKARVRERSPQEQEIIRQAKIVLIERNNMTEEEAHRYLQKCSMDSGNPLVETAKMVLTLM